MEQRDIYDINRVLTGKQLSRGEKLETQEFHLVIHAAIFNQADEMLIQQRQTTKSFFPNWWDISLAGSAISGESSQQAVQRELKEELGVAWDFSSTRPYFTINFPDGFDDYYLLEHSLELTDLTLQKEEVQQVKWASQSEILAMIEQNVFIPYHQNLIGLLFETRNHYGSFILPPY